MKGESLKHEIETYKAMGIESLVIRTKEDNIDEYREFEDISVISGGFGTSSHPTQAILDATTLDKFNKLEKDLPVIYIGDVRHSRVFESGRQLFASLGKNVGVFTHESFLPDDLTNIEVLNSWDEVLEATEAIELLRVQKERIEDLEDSDLNEYIKKYQLTNEILDKSGDDFIALHPMPMNVDIEISEKASLHNKFKYIEQLSLGVPSRIASYMYVMEQYD